MLKKWISLMLVLMLCSGSLLTSVADELIIVEESGDEELPFDLLLDEDAIILEEAEDVQLEATSQDAEDDDTVDISEDAGTYATVYYRVVSDEARMYAAEESEDPIALLNRDSVIIVTGTGAKRVPVTFMSERGVVTGFVPADALKMMSEQEVIDLQSALAQSGDVALYKDDISTPMTTPGCVFMDTSADQTEQVSSAEGTEEAKPADEPVTEESAAEVEATAEGETEEEQKPALTLSATKLTIGVKDNKSVLTATLTPADSTDTITWTNSKSSVVSFNTTTGVIKGKKAGTTKITATTSSGLTATCTVTVKKAPKKVTLNKTSLTISVGDTAKLKATLPSGTGSTLTFTSDNKAVATVKKSTGKITAVAPGSANITVTTFNNKKASCKLTVLAQPDQVFLPETITVAENEHYTLSPTVVGENDAKSTATYSFSAENGTGKITVDSKTGEVVGQSIGTALIRVTTHNGVSTHIENGERVETVCAVTVVEGPSEVKLAATKITIGVDQKYDLKPVLLNSSGTEIAAGKYTVSSNTTSKKLTVSDKGVVKGKKKGSYKVTVTAFNGVKAVCTVKVVKAPSKVTISPSKPTISVGQVLKMKGKLPSGTMASLTFTSSDKSVATVDGEGNVTGLKEGSTVIKVKTHNGKSSKTTVKVKKGADMLLLSGEYELVTDPETGVSKPVYTRSIDVGKTYKIECINESDLTISGYESDDADVASVSSKGLVTANEPGYANITVRSTTGLEAVLKVIVPGTLKGRIAFDVSCATAYVGHTTPAPGLQARNMAASTLAAAKYVADDESILSVTWDDEAGRYMLTGLKAGTTKLIATAGDASAQVDVTVAEIGKATQIEFENSLVYMKAGETYRPVVLDDYGREISATLKSSDTGVVSVGDDGVLTAVAKGTAKITATSGELSASMTVTVKTSKVSVKLNKDYLELSLGERFRLKATVDDEGASTKLTFTSSDTDVVTVSTLGVVVARGIGLATITVTESGGATAICDVIVQQAPTNLVVEPGSVVEYLDAGGMQLSWSFGVSSEVGKVKFSSANEKVATVNDSGYITFKGTGSTSITVSTNNGLTATVYVTVLSKDAPSESTTYRLFAAYSYYDSLPFTKRNASTMSKVFAKSSIGGNSYSTKVLGNPSKSALLNGITSFFSKSNDNDVSIVYLCAHGHNNQSSYSGYYMSLSNSSGTSKAKYKVTASEIFNRVKGIKGKVVLIIDSCYSGTFIEDMGSKLKAEGGRIAVLTAASNTRATYYNKKKNSVDFFTFFLLQGLGYNERDGWWNKNSSGSKGSYPGYLAADKSGNGDGIVTVGEFYNFAKNSIDANIPTYMKKSWYWGDKTKVQKTRFYAGDLKNMPLYQPK